MSIGPSDLIVVPLLPPRASPVPLPPSLSSSPAPLLLPLASPREPCPTPAPELSAAARQPSRGTMPTPRSSFDLRNRETTLPSALTPLSVLPQREYWQFHRSLTRQATSRARINSSSTVTPALGSPCWVTKPWYASPMYAILRKTLRWRHALQSNCFLRLVSLRLRLFLRLLGALGLVVCSAGARGPDKGRFRLDMRSTSSSFDSYSLNSLARTMRTRSVRDTPGSSRAVARRTTRSIGASSPCVWSCESREKNL